MKWLNRMLVLAFLSLTLSLVLWAVPVPITPEANLRDKLMERVRAELPVGSEIAIDKMVTQGEVPKGAILFGLRPQPALGLVSFELRNPTDGRSAYGSAVVRAFAPVAVTKRALRHGEELTSHNVDFERRELSQLVQSGYFVSLDLLTDLRANGYVRPGAILGSANTQAALLVSQGQAVDIIHRKGALEVIARAKAIDNGRIGDWIRVENANSKKVIRARITRSGEVETR